jgi:predicted amino acid dehydrogenase
VDADLTAEDLYNKSKRQRGKPTEKKDGVKSEILRLLDGGVVVPSAELETEVCRITGCHVNTLAAVKKELGVESYQSGRQWFSRLPSQNTENAQNTINAVEPESL